MLLLASLCISTVTLAASGSNFVEEPGGYRLSNYDDRVPDTIAGGVRVNAEQARQLQLNSFALIVDVIPEHRKPDSLPEGQLWFPVAHKGIQNALWLPDVGFGALSETTEQYFIRHLKEATNGKQDHPLVFYCRIDCWMSWNAAKRAISLGYSKVYWLADGLEDWEFEGFPTQILTPAIGERHAARE